MEVAQRIGQSVSYSTCLEEWDGLSTDYERCMVCNTNYDFKIKFCTYLNKSFSFLVFDDRKIIKNIVELLSCTILNVSPANLK